MRVRYDDTIHEARCVSKPCGSFHLHGAGRVLILTRDEFRYFAAGLPIVPSTATAEPMPAVQYVH